MNAQSVKTLTVAVVVLVAAPHLGSTEESPELEWGTPPNHTLKWQGQKGRTYFVQQSTDMLLWDYYLTIKSGAGSELQHPFGSSSPSLMLRLRICTIPTDNPATSDFDSDGEGNQDELDNGTDPLDADSDNDGIIDGADALPLNPSDGNPLYAGDSDSDGLLDSEELAMGTSPTLHDSDGDGCIDGADHFPLDPDRWMRDAVDPADTQGPTVTLEMPVNHVEVSGP